MTQGAPLVVATRSGRTAELRLNRPEKLNALSSAMIDAATAALSAFHNDHAVTVIVLRGEGRAFSAGADIEELRGLNPETARAFITRLHGLMATVRGLPQIVIASLHGHCYGGAMELAAACDLRIGAEETRFGMPEIRVGLPSVIEAALLVPLIGLGRATDLVLTGDVIDAREAERIGFLSRTVPLAQIEAETRALAEKLAGFSGPALRLQKELTVGWFGDAYERAIERGIDVLARAFASPNPSEAIAAFLAKREPRFSEP